MSLQSSSCRCSLSIWTRLLFVGLLFTVSTVSTVTISRPQAAAANSGQDGRSIERLYLAYFSRLPDDAGLSYWKARLASGTSLEAVSAQFATSPEFRSTYGSISDSEFVELVYNNVLDREPDTAGLNHWRDSLAAEQLSRGGVMLAFSDSAEFKESSGIIAPPESGSDGRSTERLYLAHFERPAEAGGLRYWESQRAGGLSLTEMSQLFATSEEFIATYGSLSDDAFVALVYGNVLDRQPDPEGQAHWTLQLATSNLSRGGVMLAFSDSAEFKTSTGIHGEPLPPDPGDTPQAGNPAGTATVPAAARAEDSTASDHVIGDGSPASCTSQAVVEAVAQGGVVTFACGPEPVVIVMQETAKVRNDANPDIVIDGAGLVTLSGGGQHRILYMNTCDQAQVWTTSHCQNQDHPRLTVQNLNLVDGNAAGESMGGGGALFVRGGRVKIVNSTFARNRCDATGPDVGGGAVRVLSQFNDLPVYVTHSTFGGAVGQGNTCSNGGGLSSIGVSYTVLNSLFSHNNVTGWGANPTRGGTPGGGSGGAIYNDGNTFTLTITGTLIEDNHAPEGGGAIFFVSNNRTGTLSIDSSILRRNPSDGFETDGLPGIFYLGSGLAQVSNSSLS